jgi:hypothetical protein
VAVGGPFAVAVARYIQNVTGFSIRYVIRTLKPLQDVTIQVAGQELTAQPKLTDGTHHIIDALPAESLGH